jgi:hypothetical protein
MPWRLILFARNAALPKAELVSTKPEQCDGGKERKCSYDMTSFGCATGFFTCPTCPEYVWFCLPTHRRANSAGHDVKLTMC